MERKTVVTSGIRSTRGRPTTSSIAALLGNGSVTPVQQPRLTAATSRMVTTAVSRAVPSASTVRSSLRSCSTSTGRAHVAPASRISQLRTSSSTRTSTTSRVDQHGTTVTRQVTNTVTVPQATAPRRSLRGKTATPKQKLSKETPSTPPKSRRRLSSKGDFSPGENMFYCPICLERVKSSGQTAALMCGHVFCMPCITTSLALKPICPICNSSVQHQPIEIFL